MAELKLTYESKKDQNPVDAIAKPIAYGGLVILISIVIIIIIVRIFKKR